MDLLSISKVTNSYSQNILVSCTKIYISYIIAYEVYGELVRDLLESQREGLNVVEDQTLGYIVPTAKSITIYSMGTGLELLQKVINIYTVPYILFYDWLYSLFDLSLSLPTKY